MNDVLWVTGDSSGLGLALCDEAHRRGTQVYGVSRRQMSVAWNHLTMDLARPEDCLRLARIVADSVPPTDTRLRFVHCAASIGPLGFAGTVADMDALFANIMLNSVAPQLLGHALLRELNQRDFRSQFELVLVSSSAPRNALPGWSSYVAGKAAMNAWVTSVGKEPDVHSFDLFVVSVEPGIIDTPMQDEIRNSDESRFPNRARFEDLHRSGRLRPPTAVAMELLALLDRGVANGAHIVLEESRAAAEPDPLDM
jgi:benzil reductase ((S)-benzoin forming)